MSEDAVVGSEGTTATAVEQIGRKASRGLSWGLFGTLVTKAGSFAIGLVLARLLTPEDFGTFAVALAATAFVMHVNDAGMIAAGMQWRGKLEDMAPTGSTIAILFSIAIYGAFWLGAPAFAELSGTPDAAAIVRILTAIIVVDGITSMRAAALMRRFEQDRLTRANMTGMVANAAIAIPLAIHGAGAYSFAWGQVAGSVVTGILIFRMGKLPIRLAFDRDLAKQLLKFGVPLAASLGFESILLNADFVIVGNALGAAALGYYLLAYNVSNWIPGIVVTAIRYVSIPGFSRLAEQSPDALTQGIKRAVPALIALILPVAVVLATLGPQVVTFVYGAEWSRSGDVLRWLAVLIIVRMLASLAFDILTSLGATIAALLLTVGWAVALIPALLVGTNVGGIVGTAVAHGIVGVVVALPLAIYLLRRAGVQLAPALPGLIRPIVGAAVASAVILLILPHVQGGSFLQLVAAGGCGMAAYALTVIPVEQFRKMMKLSIRQVRRNISR